MGAAPRGRALPVATAIVGAAVAAVAVAAGAAAARVAVAGGAAAASAVKPEVVDVGGATVDAGSAVRVVGGEVVQDGDWEGTQLYVRRRLGGGEAHYGAGWDIAQTGASSETRGGCSWRLGRGWGGMEAVVDTGFALGRRGGGWLGRGAWGGTGEASWKDGRR